MTHSIQALDDRLDNHPPLLDGGTWWHVDGTKVTAGDVLLKGETAESYTPGDDIGDLTPLFVLNAGVGGIVFWNADANAYGWYDEMFLQEDWGQRLAHIDRDRP